MTVLPAAAERVAKVRERIATLAPVSYTELSDRKREELDFHNDYRDYAAAESKPKDQFDEVYGNRRFYAITRPSTEYVEKWIERHSANRLVLDFACGDGVNALRAARSGAQLSVGIDLSDVSVGNSTAAAAQAGLSATTAFLQADCEDTRLPDGAFDTIVCSGVLHHMDLSYAFPEIRRLLAPGGRCLGVEALSVNPLIQLYRRRTPAMRTKWETEHILSPRDLQFASRFFELGEVRYWHLAAIGAAWKPSLLKPLTAVDKLLLRVPGVQQLAWIFTFELIRRD